jgi:purine catabolism regulator
VIDPTTGDPVFADSSEVLRLPDAAFDQISERFSGSPSRGPAVLRVSGGPQNVVALAVPASRPAALVAVSKSADPPDLFILRHVAAVAAMEVEKLKAERESRRRSGAELLEDLIDDHYDEDVAERLLARRDLSVKPWIVAAFASAEAGADSDLHLRLNERGVPHLLNKRTEASVLMMVHGDREIRTLLQEAGSPVGLSDPVSSSSRVADAYREALWALQGARATGSEIVCYGEDAASPFLPRDHGELRAIVHHMLGPLLEYDAEHSTPLVASLRIYLARNRSLKETSEALHVHKQTVIYRMRRVEELTGRRLGRIEDIVDFWLALRALDLLGRDG